MTATLDALFPNEVVTSATVRLTEVDGLSAPVAVIALGVGIDPTQLNTFGPAGFRNLGEALDTAFAARPSAIAFIGKPFVFSTGADLTGLPRVTDAQQSREMTEAGHAVFKRVKDSRIPTFAFVNGAAIGGGLELALHCHYRTAFAKAALFAAPECMAGMVPGWGGTQLLPNLIGADGAVTVIVENPLSGNKLLSAAEAAELGIVDLVVDSYDFEGRSLRWLASVVNGETEVERRPVDRGDAWTAAIARGTEFALAMTRGKSVGVTKALELLELARANDFDHGCAAEDDAVADLVMTEELRSGIYAAQLLRRRSVETAGAPNPASARPLRRIGIAGDGPDAEAIVAALAAVTTAEVVWTGPGEDVAALDLVIDIGATFPVATTGAESVEVRSRKPFLTAPLWEVTRGADVAVATVLSLAKAWGKTCVLVGNSPVPVAERLLACLARGVASAIGEGAAPDVAATCLEPMGLPAGVITSASVDDSPARGGDTSPEQVRARVLHAMVKEIAVLREERVVDSAEDVDLCMILDAGWPLWLGGITPYLDRTGASQTANGRRFHAPGVASLAGATE